MATSPYTQQGNSGRYAVWLQVGVWSRPTIGRSNAFDMSQPFGFQPLKMAALRDNIASAAFRIAKEADAAKGPAYAVTSTKRGVPCLYVRTKTVDGLRMVIAGLLAFGSMTGYAFRVLDATAPAENAVDLKALARTTRA